MEGSWHTYEGIMAHIWRSHGTHMSTSYNIYIYVYIYRYVYIYICISVAHIRKNHMTQNYIIAHIFRNHIIAHIFRNHIIAHIFRNHIIAHIFRNHMTRTCDMRLENIFCQKRHTHMQKNTYTWTETHETYASKRPVKETCKRDL